MPLYISVNRPKPMKNDTHLITALRALRTARQKPPSDGYDRREITFATYDECDAGGMPVKSFTISIAEINHIINALNAY